MAYQGKNNNYHNKNSRAELPALILDYTKDDDLFSETAKKYAKAISGTKKTQARNFYEKVLELESMSKTHAWEEVLPFVKMLNSKVAYGVSRKVVSSEFQSMMEECIKQVKIKEDLRVFKLFFEAVLGFFKGRE